MASVNKCIIVGNLGRDPEIRYLPSGDAIASIAVATSYKTKAKDGKEATELTEWHRVSFFGRLAEIAGQYLKKGSTVYIEGRLQTRKYQKDGQDHFATEIVAENMQMLGGKSEGEAPAQRATPAAPRPAPKPAPNFDDMDSDIPFAMNIAGHSVDSVSGQLTRSRHGRNIGADF